MNVVSLTGRLTRDPEVRHSNDLAIAKFTIAVDRPAKEKATDFPSVVCFGKVAENVGKYMVKGSQIAVVGRLQTGSYINKEGQKVYTTDVVADRVEFIGKKEDKPADTSNIPPGFEQISSDEIPF